MKLILRILASIILGALAIVFAMQLVSFVWDFPEAKPFEGPSLYNPYQGISTGEPYTKTFAKSNFHAHTCFDTRHKYTTEEFIEAYKAQGYENIGITDHQYINPKGIFPSYEHGYGLNNFHIGMYNTQKVDWIDNVYMFLPCHQMQSTFNRLNGKSEVIVYNHTDRLRLMSIKGLEFIRGYDLFELYPTAVGYIWDRVLSTGFYVPLVANDDAHSIINRNSYFQRAFTMVYRGDKNPIKALLRGHSYAVTLTNTRNAEGHKDIPQITGINLQNKVLSIKVDRKADSIRFIGQNGVLLKDSVSTDSCSYQITDKDTYVRMEVCFDGIKMFTNPVAKVGKNGFNNSYPKINYLLSVLNWIFWTIIIILDIICIRKIWGIRRNHGDNYYSRNSKHYENRVIGAGLKPIEWN